MAEQFLTLLLPSQRVMLPTQQLLEVISLSVDRLSPIPATPPYTMGVTNWRGEVLWVLDLSALLGLEPLYQQPTRLRRFPVVISSCRQNPIGLAVVQVGKMVRCAPQELRSDAPELVKFGQGAWISPDGQTILALSADKLLPISA
ncbi:MAG: chemotaxis protein CheW [Pseudanabaenaceae cyanobacterium SKYGB_i_bin29]|nr:chemotaxis protein CheW [Pseudanabaenaceae cyanobacterium SKYG29]MDW8420920.1 chemotaxis protein CheW [Pseudanabaenaceae cyanobacterium SKYGB_i_bin29]